MSNDLSICIIAKNEEKNLRQCLGALAPLKAEIIVVDTGSTDATLSVAAEYTDHTYSYKWTDDFAAARNHAAGLAANDIILMVDCDEYLEKSDVPLLYSLIKDRPADLGMITRLNPYHSHGERQLMHEHVARLYDRTRLTWHGTIHENLVPLSPDGEFRYYELPLTFYHAGYEDEDVRRKKAERDLKMLETRLSKEGDDPYVLFQMGQCYTVLQDPAGAAEYYNRGLSLDVDPRLVYVQDMLTGYGYALLDLKEYEQALGLESVYDLFSGRADFHFLMGLIYMNNARFDDAIREFTKATKTTAFSVEGTNSYRALYNIGVILEVTGRTSEAIEKYKACGDYGPAVERVGKIQG